MGWKRVINAGRRQPAEVVEKSTARRAQQRPLQPMPRYVEPTLQQRLNRLNPAEREEVRQIMRKLLLRKTIRRVLHEAHLAREFDEFLARRRANLVTYEPVMTRRGPQIEVVS